MAAFAATSVPAALAGETGGAAAICGAANSGADALASIFSVSANDSNGSASAVESAVGFIADDVSLSTASESLESSTDAVELSSVASGSSATKALEASSASGSSATKALELSPVASGSSAIKASELSPVASGSSTTKAFEASSASGSAATKASEVPASASVPFGEIDLTPVLFASNAEFVASAANAPTDFVADSCDFQSFAVFAVSTWSVAPVSLFFAFASAWPFSPFLPVLSSSFFAVSFGFFESPPNQPRTRANKPPDFSAFSFFSWALFPSFEAEPSSACVFIPLDATVCPLSVAATEGGSSAFFPARFPDKKSAATQTIVNANEEAIATPIVFFATRIQLRPSNSSPSSSNSSDDSSTTLAFAFFASAFESSDASASSQSSSSSFFRFNRLKGAAKPVPINFK